MKISQNGINLIKQFEGCRLKAYKCPAGVWTIGYGTTAGVCEGMSISQTQAEKLLRNDLVKFEAKVMKYDAKYHWNQNEFDALVSFAYNLGSIDGLTNNGTRDKNTISHKMLQYNKAAGKVLSGLTKRRQLEQALFLKPCTNTEVVTVAETIEYYPKCSQYVSTMIVALSSVGESDTSLAHRKKIGLANGITNVGSVSANNKMLKLLKEGKLIKA